MKDIYRSVEIESERKRQLLMQLQIAMRNPGYSMSNSDVNGFSVSEYELNSAENKMKARQGSGNNEIFEFPGKNPLKNEVLLWEDEHGMYDWLLQAVFSQLNTMVGLRIGIDEVNKLVRKYSLEENAHRDEALKCPGCRNVRLGIAFFINHNLETGESGYSIKPITYTEGRFTYSELRRIANAPEELSKGDQLV